MPFFNNSEPATASADDSGSSGWKLPRWWGKKETPSDSQFFYQKPEPPPSTTARITSAMTDNSAVRAARSWMAPDDKVELPKKPDALSLSQPTGKPTPTLMVSLAQVRERQGDLDGARQMYQQALAAGPKRVATLRELGHFEDRQNRLADAERYYAEAAKFAPQNPAVLNDLALCLARQGKAEPSVSVLSQAIQLEPTKPLYRNNMATVLMELGAQHEAMQHLMAVHPPAAAYYNMAHLLEKGGQMEAAAAHYAEAARLDPSMTAAQSALARVAPAPQASVPQTAMMPAAPASVEPQFGPQSSWPSEPIAARVSERTTSPSDYGPRLLPPVE